jgi:hypothetical protein
MDESDNLRLRSKFSLQLFPYHESNTAQITSDLQVTLGHFLAVGDHHIASLGSCGMSVLPPLSTISETKTLNLPSLLTI